MNGGELILQGIGDSSLRESIPPIALVGRIPYQCVVAMSLVNRKIVKALQFVTLSTLVLTYSMPSTQPSALAVTKQHQGYISAVL